MKKFAISRESGKSAAEVLCEVVNSASPGDVLTYERLGAALSEGASRQYGKREVQAAVCRSERQLATKHCRALINVPREGYRIAMAAEHQMIAGRKRDRSKALYKRGLTVLQHVDWSAMDENERRAHEGQMLIMSSMYHTMRSMDERLRRVEDAVAQAKSS